MNSLSQNPAAVNEDHNGQNYDAQRVEISERMSSDHSLIQRLHEKQSNHEGRSRKANDVAEEPLFRAGTSHVVKMPLQVTAAKRSRGSCLESSKLRRMPDLSPMYFCSRRGISSRSAENEIPPQRTGVRSAGFHWERTRCRDLTNTEVWRSDNRMLDAPISFLGSRPPELPSPPLRLMSSNSRVQGLKPR